MPLARRSTASQLSPHLRSPIWEVDKMFQVGYAAWAGSRTASCPGPPETFSESGIEVFRNAEDRWQVTIGPGAQEYLVRHRLEEARFPTRARAVEAVRLALSAEPSPRSRVVLIRWKKLGEEKFISRDGHWSLSRSEEADSIRPLSPQARALATAQGYREADYELSPWRERRETLRKAGQRAEGLVTLLTLDGSVLEPATRVGEDEYLSRDGHWGLRRETAEERLHPLSVLAQERLAELEQRGRTGLPLRVERDTLRSTSIHAGQLNRLLGLDK